MAKLIIYDPSLSREEINLLQLKENMKLTPQQRIEKMFMLMTLSAKFKRGPLKEPDKNALVLKSSRHDSIR